MTATFRFGTAGVLILASIVAGALTARAEAGPFTVLNGTWSGEGNITTSGGLRERLRCRATYRAGDGGDQVQLALRCASDSYNFDLAGQVAHRNGTISGSWTEASRRASGTISGRAVGDQIDANANGGTFSVSLSMTTRGNRQAVTIHSLAAEVTNVSITLSR